METNKDKTKLSNIYHKKTIFNNIKRFNSPIFDKQRIKNYFLVSEKKINHKKISDLTTAKSSKNMKHNQTCMSKRLFEINKDDDIKFIHKKKINSNSPYNSNDNSKVIYKIKTKITFQSFNNKKLSQKNSNNNIIEHIYKKENNNKNNKSIKKKGNSSENSINQIIKNNLKTNKNNCIDKIFFNKNPSNRKKFFYTSKLSISLDNILNKNVNKNKKQNKKKKNPKSFEKRDKSITPSETVKNIKTKSTIYFVGNNNSNRSKKQDNNDIQISPRCITNNKLRGTKINLEKNRKIYHFYRQKENKYKSENMTEIMSHINNSNLFINNKKINDNKETRLSDINPINYKNKNFKKNITKKENKHEKIFYSPKKSKKFFNYSEFSRNIFLLLDECHGTINDQKILCENNSTNDKSLNTKIPESKKTKNVITPNIFFNKFKKKINNKNNIRQKKNNTNNDLLINNDEFITYELDLGNEQNTNINGVKINNFDVKKPKEENLKFTFMKEEKESEISFSHASKIIIGNIDGYKDIIETDIKNNENKFTKCFGNLINNKKSSFFINNNNTNYKIYGDPEDLSSNSITKKKNSDLSILLKKEIEHFNFNESKIYDSFNMTNNLDGISSTLTNNIVNDNKKEKEKDKDNEIIYMNYINTDNNINNIFINDNDPFDIEGDKGDIFNNIHYSNIKSNNLDIITNKNIMLNYNKNNCGNSNQNKQDKIKKVEDVNNNCYIY